MNTQYTVKPELVKVAEEIAAVVYKHAAEGKRPRINTNCVDGKIYASFHKDCCKYDMRTALSSQLTLN